MKYQAHLSILKVLVYIKRFLWWLGGRLSLGFQFILIRIWQIKGYFSYRLQYRLKKIGLTTGRDFFVKRAVLQGAILALLILIGLPQSQIWERHDFGQPGQNTKLYSLISDTADAEVYEEVTAAPGFSGSDTLSAWQQGVLSTSMVEAPPTDGSPGFDTLADTASGQAIQKPLLMPGAIVSGRATADVYEVVPGDSLYSIAADFGVSVATILWENSLTTQSILRPNDKLTIPPVTGVMHLVKRGDTVGKIALLYSADPDDIITFNRLGAHGEGLRAGERIMVPGGVKAAEKAYVQISRRPPTLSPVRRGATPPPSTAAAGSSGFIWPTGARVVTQGFGITHHALDIAGPFHTPNYAANAGRVVTADCPPPGEYRGKTLNHGYGCWVIIDHGNGIKTLYGHNDQILVSPGEYVERGQTVGLMGNTGNVRGVTGIHLHFEVIVNGQRVNPYGYVR